MSSPISNRYELLDQAPKLTIERQLLYDPTPGKDWLYSHHPFITHFKGSYYAVWSNGEINEDDVGQRLFWSRSSDGMTWQEASPLIDSLPGHHSDVVLSPAGFHHHQGTLNVYFYQYEYAADAIVDGHRKPSDAHHLDTRLLLRQSSDGITWGKTIDTGLKVGPNHPPQPTASGRLIISVSFTYPYTDDPSGVRGWTMGGLYPSELAGTVVDDSEGIWRMKDAMGWDSVICEGSFFQTDDEVIHMMLRTNTGRLKVTESRDDGVTWSEAQWTDFTDNSTKFHFGRLPDGRFYYVGSPDPEPQWSRPRLVLSLSDDGIHFDAHYIIADENYVQKQEGMHKNGNYGYPHTLVHDQYLWLICSRRKEAIEIIKIPLDQLR